MKKEVFIHLISFLILFALISLFKNYLNISYWPFWVGGLVGTILPDIDHLIYVYFLRPTDLTSQRVVYGLANKNFLSTWQLLAATRTERTQLVLHTAVFQIVFLILSFLVITSSGNLFGRGLVVAFLLHLSIDQITDLRSTGNLATWFRQIPIALDQKQLTYYTIAMFAAVLIFGVVL